MPDGKPNIEEDLEDDPFEGVELGDDAPEPTQEEMDEWATLDTPDEDVSPSIGARSASPAAAPVAPSSAAPAPEPQNEEQHKKDELAVQDKSEEEGRGRPSDTEPGPTSSAASFAAPEPKPEAPSAADELQAMKVATSAPSISPTEATHAAGLSEITPSSSPPPPPRTAKDQVEYDDEEDGDENDDRSVLQRQQQQQQQQQQESGGGGWGVGWGSRWGLGALGGKLREVAAGAVRDVKDLTETFQAALADVTGAEDEVEQAGRISAMDRATEAAEAGGDAAEDPEGKAAKEASSASPTDAPRQAAEPAREGAAAAHGGHAAGAARSIRAASAGSTRGSAGGAGEAGPSAPADPALEAGLQAIDAQVEQLATGAARAFSSLWGGLSSVAKVVAAEVAASVADVQSIEAVRGVAQIGTKLAHTAERGLETVGRTAMVLLEEVAGVGGGGGGLPGRRRIWGEEADARAADMGREPASFQDFFYIYGGEQLAEEVNNLSNECAHLCNRSRSKLEGDQQQALDEALARLGPYFNDPWVGAKQAAAAEAAESGKAAGDAAAAAEAPSSVPELDAGSTGAAEQLGQMYDPIGYLCQDSLSRSEAFLHQLLEAVAAARAAEAATTASSAKRAASKAPAGEGEEGADDGDGEEEEGDEEEREALLLRVQRQRAEPRVLLESFRTHFTKRLAEVTTAQLQLMLNLGASLAAPARTGRPAVDGIAWPDSSEQQAALLAAEARRMVADLQAITHAYAATINALRAAPPSHADEGAVEGGDGAEGAAEQAPVTAASAPVVDGKVLDEMAAALTANSESATSSIKGGYKGLLYAVLLRSLVTQIAQQQEAAEMEAEDDSVSGGGAGVSSAGEEAQAPSAEQ